MPRGRFLSANFEPLGVFKHADYENNTTERCSGIMFRDLSWTLAGSLGSKSQKYFWPDFRCTGFVQYAITKITELNRFGTFSVIYGFI